MQKSQRVMCLIDLHTHILPAVDDGSKSVEMSLEMLRLQGLQNVETICATSHYYRERNSIEDYCARRDKAYAHLAKALPPDAPQILPAAETAYFRKISECRELERLCIPGTRILLLEMPFCDWDDFQVEEVNSLALDRGFRVILAHPERFCFSTGNRDRLHKLMQLPLALQINAGSLLHLRSRHLSLSLLKEAPIACLASDCHDPVKRPPNLQAGRAVVAKKLGQNFLDRLDLNAKLLIKHREN